MTLVSSSHALGNWGIKALEWWLDDARAGGNEELTVYIGEGTHTIVLNVTDDRNAKSEARGVVKVTARQKPSASFIYEWQGQTGSEGSSVKWTIDPGTVARVLLRASSLA